MCSSSVVSVALLRVMGRDVAELPLVATLGNAQGLVSRVQNSVHCLKKCFGTVAYLPDQSSTCHIQFSCVSVKFRFQYSTVLVTGYVHLVLIWTVLYQR